MPLPNDTTEQERGNSPDLGPDYRVMLASAGTQWGHVIVTVDHIPTWRRKSGTSQAGREAHMAACLKEDIENDLRDVAEGILPTGFGRFAPDEDRTEGYGPRP
jgi:hypothetical protein